MPRQWRAARGGLAFAVVIAAGLAQAVSVGTPWRGDPVWWLQILALAALVWQLQRQLSWWRGALLGWAFATAWLTGTFWWLFISMHTYGGLAAPLTALAVVGLAAFLGSYYALACGVFTAIGRRGWARGAVVFGALWLLAELMRVTWFTGFPWGAGGYAHVDGPLAALAKTIGVHGIGAVAAMASALLVGWPRRQRGERGGWVLLLWVLPVAALGWAGRATYSESAGKLDVALLQGNVPQEQKFQGRTGIPLALNWYAEQLEQSSASFVVTPETAIPLLPAQLPPGYLAAINQRFTQGRQAALIGIPLGSYEQGYTNSVLGFRPGAEVYRFDKHHLVPFGEFIPPLFRWFTQMMNIPLGDFNRGAVGQPSFEWSGQRFAPNICYEDLFGEELGRRFIDPASAPTVFVNASNIGWFGNTIAIDQHLQISRLRALEFERPMLRATNTGATVIIDHRGRVTHALDRATRGVLVGEVEGRTGITPYAWWVARGGLWPLWLLFGAIAALALLRRRTALARP